MYVPSSVVKERWNMTQTYWWQGVIWVGWGRLDATIESGNIAFVKVIHKHIKSRRDVVCSNGTLVAVCFRQKRTSGVFIGQVKKRTVSDGNITKMWKESKEKDKIDKVKKKRE